MHLMILFVFVSFFGDGLGGKILSLRRKRDAVGALDIVTNHASPIHADVNVDPGNNVKVTPPKDTIYEVKSLRKSYPLTSQLDLIRAINRIAALAVIILSAAVEFYPVVANMYNSIYEFFYFNKY